MKLEAGEMKDPRWPADDGWVKMFRKFTTEDEDIEIHWVYNEETGVADDFKFVGGPPK